MPDRSPGTAVDTVAGFLSAHTGLDFSGNRGKWLRDFFTASQDLHDEDWVDRLVAGDTGAFDRLCDVATVQESFFFREPASLEVLRERLLPELRERPGDIRAWSAGCAGGEEAYTLALLLAEAGLARRSGVLGTDLARVAMVASRRGYFGSWSLRGVDAATIERCFVPSGNGFTVPGERRAPVRFEQHNLLSGSVPAGGPFDIVLCRNVLIYLTPDAVRSVGALLAESLRPGGVLVTGIADPALGDVEGLVRERTAGGTVYRRVDKAEATTAPSSGRQPPRARRPARRPRPALLRPRGTEDAAVGSRTNGSSTTGRPSAGAGTPWTQSAEQALLLAEPREAERLARAALTATRDRRSAHAMLVRALAGDARLHEALAAAEHAVAECSLDAELHGLHASVLLEAGRTPEARDAARRALYLDPDNALAHLVLARAAELLGDARTAARARRHGHLLLFRNGRT